LKVRQISTILQHVHIGNSFPALNESHRRKRLCHNFTLYAAALS
jgi:hypothetical protein